MSRDRRLFERKVLKRPLYTGGAVNFCADRIMLPDGRHAVREYLDHLGAVGVLAATGRGEIVMVRQYRYPVGEVTWEIPAGKLHHKRDNPLKRAREELREETGYSARGMRRLLTYWPCPAFSNEVLTIYLAHGLVPGKSSPDDDEFLRVDLVPFSKAYGWVMNGKIKDSKTVIALQAYRILGR